MSDCGVHVIPGFNHKMGSYVYHNSHCNIVSVIDE